MSEEATGFVVFCVTAVVVSLAAHAFVRRSEVAAAASAIISTIVFNVFAYLKAGYLDPFILIAVMSVAACAYVVAYVVGIPFRIVRTNRAVADATPVHEQRVSDDEVRLPGDWMLAAVTCGVVFMVVMWLVEVARRRFAPGTVAPLYVSGGVPLLVGVVSSLMLLRLRRAERRQKMVFMRSHCCHCGYDLTGNESGVCPECGMKIESQ